MVGHGQVAHADAYLVVQAHVERIDARKHPAVPGPKVEVQHGHDFGRVAAGVDVVGVEQKTKVALHLGNPGVGRLGVGDPHAHHAHGHLRHLVGVRVVHECAGAAGLELVDKGLARLNGRLGEARDAVHAVGQALAVPVHAGVLGQAVGDEDAHPVPLDHLNGGARRLAVVAPQVGLEARRHFAHHRLGHQMKLFDTLAHAPRQGPAVERDNRVVGPPGVGHQRRHGVGATLQHRLGQGGQCDPADSGGSHRAPG